ncbi:MAG: hypothetical protein WB791_10395 [Waddliaceae bacterium]
MAKALGKNSRSKVTALEQKIGGWLGKDSRLVKNKAGDIIILSQDGTRKVRFDFKNPFPHETLIRLSKRNYFVYI